MNHPGESPVFLFVLYQIASAMVILHGELWFSLFINIIANHVKKMYILKEHIFPSIFCFFGKDYSCYNYLSFKISVIPKTF